MRRLLVTGGSGLLGRQVARRAVESGWAVTATYCSQPVALEGVEMLRLDLADGAALIAQLQPDAVVHTAYNRAPGQLWSITARAAGVVAQACARSGARLIHLSSDAVFGGRELPYGEADEPDPIMPYGAAKVAAELLVQSACPAALLVRTSLLYVAPGATPADPYLLMVQEMLRDPARGALFTDEFRCPLCVDDLAAALLELLEGDASGLLHVAGPLPLNRYEFGQLLARSAGLDAAGLRPASGRALCRPTRVVLRSERAGRLLTTLLRSPYDVLGGTPL